MRWWRITLSVAAAIYYFMLIRHPPQRSILRPVAFFTECTCLFPGASSYAIEFRLEGWSCTDRRWVPMDPRPYFPIEADDKESRFQRLGYFYQGNRTVMRALAAYIVGRHPSVDDGVAGPIGGIKLSKLDRPLPPPGAPVARYVYRPTAPPLADDLYKELYWTSLRDRDARCTEGP